MSRAAWIHAPLSIGLLCAPLYAQPAGSDSAFTPRGSAGLVSFPWEISFGEGLDVAEYARQLDYFKIEIAAVAKDGTVDYISHVARDKPERRAGKQSDDERLRIGWTKGTLEQVDRRLLRKAGVTTTGKQVLHFFPREVQDQLARLEQAYAGHKPEEIRRTLFRIRPAAKVGTYEFEVVEQVPPKPTVPAATRARQSRSSTRCVARYFALSTGGRGQLAAGEQGARCTRLPTESGVSPHPVRCAHHPLPQGERGAGTAYGAISQSTRSPRSACS